jgi:hypothetical protein
MKMLYKQIRKAYINYNSLVILSKKVEINIYKTEFYIILERREFYGYGNRKP